MTITVGINGFGRMGRLALRAAWSDPNLQFVQVNDAAGDAATLAHLLNFDSVHGRWAQEARAEGDAIAIGARRIALTRNQAIADTDWSACDVVIEASGKFRRSDLLQPYLDQGVKRVVVTELKGRLNGHAVRVPLTNASLTDCVFEVERATSVEEVNGFLKAAAEQELNGILGFEKRPLVSIDYRGDPRSGIVDAPSTMVVNGTHVKIYAWYDNEWGYVNRTAELVRLVGA